jgi:hypothetical protein
VDPATPENHLNEEILETYALGHMSEISEQAVEDHLFECETCRCALEELENYLLVTRLAMRDLVRDQSTVPFAARVRQKWALARNPLWAGSLVVATVVGFVSWQSERVPEPPPVIVKLEALRGIDDTANQACSDREIVLNADIRGLPDGMNYRLEVVDANGKQIWVGPGSPSNDIVVAHLKRRVGRGMYWVRLYGSGAELLREYGLRVE